MNFAPQRVRYFTDAEPAMLIPSARNITRVHKGIGSGTSMWILVFETSMHRPGTHCMRPLEFNQARRTGFSDGIRGGRLWRLSVGTPGAVLPCLVTPSVVRCTFRLGLGRRYQAFR